MMKAALILARSGVLVFPCNADDKSPRTTHGFHDATTDLDIVRAQANPANAFAVPPVVTGFEQGT